MWHMRTDNENVIIVFLLSGCIHLHGFMLALQESHGRFRYIRNTQTKQLENIK